MGICARLALRNSAQRHRATVANSVSGRGTGIISSIWQPFVQLGALLFHWRWGQEAPYVSTMIKLRILELRVVYMLVKWQPHGDCGGPHAWWGRWEDRLAMVMLLLLLLCSILWGEFCRCNFCTATTQFYPVDSMVPNMIYPVDNTALNNAFQMNGLFNRCVQLRPSTSKVGGRLDGYFQIEKSYWRRVTT